MATRAEGELISVVMPAYNAAAYLREAIESALAQQEVEVELVIVDDGSTDHTAEIAESFGNDVVFERATHVGMDLTRNRAVELASGAYLAFLDADDIYPPRSLAVRLARLHADPELDAVYGRARQFYTPEAADRLRDEVRIPKETVAVEQATTLLIHRDAFDRVGPFGDWKVGGSIDWTLRAREAGLRTVMLDDVVLERRIHSGNHGRVARSLQNTRLHVLKAGLDRRRAAVTRRTQE